MNQLMAAAIRLHHKIDIEEIEDWMKCVGDNFNVDHIRERRLSSVKIFAWGMHRWGRAFSYAEYDYRELKK